MLKPFPEVLFTILLSVAALPSTAEAAGATPAVPGGT